VAIANALPRRSEPTESVWGHIFLATLITDAVVTDAVVTGAVIADAAMPRRS
jgi:hypothetical protein